MTAWTEESRAQWKTRLSDAARRRWADPEFRRRQREAIEEGKSRSRAPAKVAKGQKTKGGKMQVTVHMDCEMFKAIQRNAMREGRGLSEIVRTYITWGLDEEECADV